MPERHPLTELIDNNRRWSEARIESDPRFFDRLLGLQTPEYLWIGCSDSRVPANEIVGLDPGELFVHRNVANVVVHSDLNCLSVLQYAVDVLKVKHIIVCGHYGCGGVEAAMTNLKLGLINNWLRHIQDVDQKYATHLTTIAERSKRLDTLCKLNVIEQAVNVAQTTVLESAWARGQEVRIHGWAYRLTNGLVNDLNIDMGDTTDIEDARLRAVQKVIGV